MAELVVQELSTLEMVVVVHNPLPPLARHQDLAATAVPAS